MSNVCSNCGGVLEKGYLFSTKDGAFSFADEVPNAFENARHASGFIEVCGAKVGGRAAVAAETCCECKTIIVNYE